MTPRQAWTFVPSERCLIRGVEVVRLTPKAAAVLTVLLDHAGEVVSREALLAAVWPGLHVTPDLVREYVSDLRSALGDAPKVPRYIETVRGKGFRLIGGVSFAGPTGALDDAARERPQRGDATAEPRVVASDAIAPDVPARDEGIEPISKEIKAVTVLSCAIADARLLSDRLGAEAMDEIMERFASSASTVVERHGGTVVRWSGDGFLALFGAPVAYEDDPRRAVLASLELRERFEGGERPLLGGSHRAAFGIHAGDVVVGPSGPGDRPFTARGPTTDTAVELSSRAGPGTILLSDCARERLAGEIDADPVVAAKGERYHVLRAMRRQKAGILSGSNAERVSFVGRQQQLDLLGDALERARAGSGQIVGVVGEPGIGKSHLLRQFRRLSAVPSGAWLECQGLPYRTQDPYAPLADLVRQACAVDLVDDDQETASKVAALCDGLGFAGSDGALLAKLIGLSAGEEQLSSLSPRAQRTRTFCLLETLLLHIQPQAPVVLAIEDVHWLDATSRAWLDHVALRVSNIPVLVVITYRPWYELRLPLQSPITQLALPPLGERDGAALARATLPPEGCSTRLLRDIVQRAAGNPFFILELSKALAQQPGAPALGGHIPASIRSVIAARIDRLDSADKTLLQVCSVMGHTIRRDVLASFTGLDEDELDSRLDALAGAGFVVETAGSAHRTIRFRHALTQEATYGSLLGRTRADLHRDVARCLETHFPLLVKREPETIALHCEMASEYRAAARHWARASRNAYRGSANEEAAAYARRGLKGLAVAEGPAPVREEAALQLALAPAVAAAHGYGASFVAPIYARAKSLCESVGDTRGVFRSLIGLWNYHWVRGSLGRAEEAASSLLAIAERSGDDQLLLRAGAAMGEILFHLGHFEASLAYLERAIVLFDASPTRTRAAEVPKVACLCYAAWSLWHRGETVRSAAYAREARVIAEELKHPLSLALCLALTAELHQDRLEPDACRDTAERALAVSREQGFPFWEATATILLGWSECAGGEIPRGRAKMERGLSVFIQTGAKVQLATWLGLMADIDLREGRHDAGLALIARSLRFVGRTADAHYHGELSRLKGALLLDRGNRADLDAAEDAFRCAIAIARAQGARIREVRAALGLADLWRTTGRSDAVRSLPQLDQSWFCTAADSVDVQRARTVLDTLC